VRSRCARSACLSLATRSSRSATALATTAHWIPTEWASARPRTRGLTHRPVRGPEASPGHEWSTGLNLADSSRPTARARDTESCPDAVPARSLSSPGLDRALRPVLLRTPSTALSVTFPHSGSGSLPPYFTCCTPLAFTAPPDTRSGARARHGSSLGCASGASALAQRARTTIGPCDTYRQCLVPRTFQGHRVNHRRRHPRLA
jgi:hypothetical protein